MLAAVLLLIAAGEYPVIDYSAGYPVIEYQSAEQPQPSESREEYIYKLIKHNGKWWTKDRAGNWLVYSRQQGWLPFVAKIHAVAIDDASLALIDAGKALGVRSLVEGRLDATLQDHAAAHARYQADRQTQGHQNFERRHAQLSRLFPGMHISEICAESWEWETTHSAAAASMYDSWRQSPGHWETANGSCKFYGYAMSQGRNGIWYSCGIVAR